MEASCTQCTPPHRLCKIFSLTADKSHLLPMPQATWGTYPFPRQACEPRARPCAEYITVSEAGTGRSYGAPSLMGERSSLSKLLSYRRKSGNRNNCSRSFYTAT